MSSYSPPERPASEIISVLSKTGIAALKPEDLANLTPDLVFAIYSNIISYVDPLSDDSDGQISFEALQIIDSPEHHAHSIRILDLYHRLKDLLSSIHVTTFALPDLLAPDHRRTLQILSSIVNFIYHRDDKLNMLQPLADQLSEIDERRMELEGRIAELNKEILDQEVARQMEEPMVQEVDAEVKELKQTIPSYNKQQASLKTRSIALKEKIDAIEEKITTVDFELVQSAQENSRLTSEIVQSPDKLQRALEVKKSNRAEIKNSERLAEQGVQEKAANLEVYSKAFEKMSKHLAQVQTIQEQVNSAKTVDKDVKALKDKLSDEGVSAMTLEAKVSELKRKAKQTEERIQVKEKERDTRHTQDTQRLQTVRTEMEQKLKILESREKDLEAVVAKSESLCAEAGLVRETGKVEQHKLQAKLEEVIHMYQSYSDMVSPWLQ